jgi:hypothetical protein
MDFAAEVTNTFALCYVCTELFYNGYRPTNLWASFAIVAVVNGLWAVSLVLPQVWPTALEIPPLLQALPLLVLVSLPLLMLMLFAKLHFHSVRSLGVAPFASVPMIVLLALHWARLQVPSALKLDMIMLFYILLCWLDLRRHLSRDQFLRQLARAVAATLALFPALAVGIAALMLLVANALDALGSDSHILAGPIYYGVFYGPFAFVYVFMKRGALQPRASLPR